MPLYAGYSRNIRRKPPKRNRVGQTIRCCSKQALAHRSSMMPTPCSVYQGSDIMEGPPKDRESCPRNW